MSTENNVKKYDHRYNSILRENIDQLIDQGIRFNQAKLSQCSCNIEEVVFFFCFLLLNYLIKIVIYFYDNVLIIKFIDNISYFIV